ncbi:hypothetical protein SAMN04488543_3023 [Friedmanniella luteola]|uniref:DUF2332 domain-containing protein n=1 Tax=Friedmanniella luteola TaxID=546871 RepID=A0A1H1XLN1_9ACTN|nr:DUF2332 domain-containing protein [Friedmanniella luteola]SDT09636.1 hypothetical protein SAMN04488543_3023 [Friedmanniella luteola]
MPGDDAALARAYRRFGAVPAAGRSPLHQHVALALSTSPAVLRALAAAPARQRGPARVLAAVQDLALAGRAPAFAAACAALDADAAAEAAAEVVLRRTDAVLAVAGRRPVRTDETGRGAVLHPAIAEAAHRLGAGAVGLVDVGCSAGFDLDVGRVGVTASNGQRFGDPASPVQLTVSVVGDRPLPARDLPEVVARVGVDRDPLDVTDADDVRWLRACLGPDQPGRRARLDAEMALLASAPPVLLRGDVVDLLPAALARVPAGALPVVTTTWALSAVTPAGRRRFLQHLEEASAGRPVAWVSAEGVGVAPTVPTLGDRPASGHSILGLVVLDGSAPQAEALGRCWSRGRLLAWLGDA